GGGAAAGLLGPPAERVGADLGEDPSQVHIVAPAGQHDALFVGSGNKRDNPALLRTVPGGAPGAECRIIETYRYAPFAVGFGTTVGAARIDPDVGDGAAIEHPGEVPLGAGLAHRTVRS